MPSYEGISLLTLQLYSKENYLSIGLLNILPSLLFFFSFMQNRLAESDPSCLTRNLSLGSGFRRFDWKDSQLSDTSKGVFISLVSKCLDDLCFPCRGIVGVLFNSVVIDFKLLEILQIFSWSLNLEWQVWLAINFRLFSRLSRNFLLNSTIFAYLLSPSPSPSKAYPMFLLLTNSAALRCTPLAIKLLSLWIKQSSTLVLFSYLVADNL